MSAEANCSKCGDFCSWRDGVPDDPADRLCDTCVWDTLDAVRAERNAAKETVAELILQRAGDDKRAADFVRRYAFVIKDPVDDAIRTLLHDIADEIEQGEHRR